MISFKESYFVQDENLEDKFSNKKEAERDTEDTAEAQTKTSSEEDKVLEAKAPKEEL